VNRSGQFAAWVKAHTELPLISLNKYGGLPFTPGEIRAKIMEFLPTGGDGDGRGDAAEVAETSPRREKEEEVDRG
jgi:hypothetical protein